MTLADRSLPSTTAYDLVPFSETRSQRRFCERVSTLGAIGMGGAVGGVSGVVADEGVGCSAPATGRIGVTVDREGGTVSSSTGVGAGAFAARVSPFRAYSLWSATCTRLSLLSASCGYTASPKSSVTATRIFNGATSASKLLRTRDRKSTRLNSSHGS